MTSCSATKVLRNKIGFMQINLELLDLRVPLVAFIFQSWVASTSKYSWRVPDYSNGQTMKKTSRKEEMKTSTRIRLVSYRQELPVAVEEGFDYVSSACVFCCKT